MCIILNIIVMESDYINVPSYKLKLCSKKLESGKFQVKFYASKDERSQDTVWICAGRR